MLKGQRIALVIPAYNAAKTLQRVIEAVPRDIIDDIIVGDDASSDSTVELAHRLKVQHVIEQKRNSGYGANQKACYDRAIQLGADIVVMLHGDYQYDPRLVRAMASVISEGVYPAVFASRLLGKGARAGGMPLYRFLANRLLTKLQNFLIGENLSEYHTGYRAFASFVLKDIPYGKFSDSFFFDNQMAVSLVARRYDICEISCPTRYELDSSSISLIDSVKYAFQVVWLSIKYRMSLFGLKLYRT